MYDLIVQNPAERFIKQLTKEEQTIIFDEIEKLAYDPFLGKELQGRLAGLRSLRIDGKSSYRVIYKIYSSQLVVLVLQAGYRKNIYAKQIRRSKGF